MIQNCLKQYYSDTDSLPISKREMEKLCKRIMQMKAEDPNIELYEAVNDIVYEFLTE